MIHVRQLQVYRQNQIITADPGTILILLYQGAIDALKRAMEHLAAGNVSEKGRYILQANDIITQFIQSLDHDVGGEMARNLEGLYRYMLDQILLANVNNDPERLQSIVALLTTLKEGWEAAVAAQRQNVAQDGAQ